MFGYLIRIFTSCFFRHCFVTPRRVIRLMNREVRPAFHTYSNYEIYILTLRDIGAFIHRCDIVLFITRYTQEIRQNSRKVCLDSFCYSKDKHR